MGENNNNVMTHQSTAVIVVLLVVWAGGPALLRRPARVEDQERRHGQGAGVLSRYISYTYDTLLFTEYLGVREEHAATESYPKQKVSKVKLLFYFGVLLSIELGSL